MRMDVAHDHEATFNEVYDREHLPNLAKVPGVQRASRFKQPSPTEPRYLAAYELDSPDVIASAAFKTAGELGRWPTAVRPHTMNRHLAIYEWVGGAKALTGKTKYLFWVMMDIEPHREALFNDLYDNEHLPLLMKLPGSVNAVRYRTKRRASRSTFARTRWRTPSCRCRSSGTTPRTSGAGSPKCDRTPTTSAISSASGSASPLARIEPHDLVEAAEAYVERGVGDQFDHFRLRKLGPYLRPEGVVDLVVVDGKLLREVQRRPLPRGQQRGGLVVDRRDLLFGRPRMPGPGIA